MTPYKAEKNIEKELAMQNEKIEFEKTVESNQFEDKKSEKAHDISKRIPPEEWRFRNFINIVMRAANLAGLEIQGRIVVKDKRTGRIFQ